MFTGFFFNLLLLLEYKLYESKDLLLCSLKKLRHLECVSYGLLGRKKSYDQLSILKSRDITLPTKVI